MVEKSLIRIHISLNQIQVIESFFKLTRLTLDPYYSFLTKVANPSLFHTHTNTHTKSPETKTKSCWDKLMFFRRHSMIYKWHLFFSFLHNIKLLLLCEKVFVIQISKRNSFKKVLLAKFFLPWKKGVCVSWCRNESKNGTKVRNRCFFSWQKCSWCYMIHEIYFAYFMYFSMWLSNHILKKKEVN